MLRLYSFGGLRLEGPNGPVGGAGARRRPLAVLAVIAASGPRGVSRERLVGILWPEGTEEQGRHALAQVLYALRRDADADIVEPGAVELRLNPAVISADVAEFAALLARGDRTAALQLYSGPFLDGFYLSQTPEFEHWTEEQRTRLAARYRDALEHEAAGLEAAGAARRAADRWRELVALDPLATEPRLGLMRSLYAAGNPAGALDEARAHADAIDRELGMAPSPEIVALAHQIRTEREAVPAAAPAAATESPLPSTTPPALEPSARTLMAGPRWLPALIVLALVGLILGRPARKRALPVVAVGIVESHLPTDTLGLARSLSDLLATHLVQVRGLRVVGRARLLEVLSGGAGTAAPGNVTRAARIAGADELIEGALYPDAAGLRLDLRRSGLGDGQVREAVSVTAPEPVALVETAVAALAETWGLPAPTRSLHSVTSVSLVARRFYDEGLRALYSGDLIAAADFFRVALAEDTTFAMAAYYLARTMSDAAADSAGGRWRNAVRLAGRATDRERLLILASGALELNDARGLAYAETLAVRYPDDLDGIRVLGDLRFARGEFAAAADAFERVMQLDSAGRQGQAARCHACDAAEGAFWASLTGDSLARAERIARRVLTWPSRRRGYALLVTVLSRKGNAAAALAAARAAALQAPWIAPEAVAMGSMRYAGNLATLDSMLSARLAVARLPEERALVLLRLSEIRREAGRPQSALSLAQELERLEQAKPNYDPRNPFLFLPRALALLSLGRTDPAAARAAAAVFDSMARVPAYAEPRMARHRAWMWTHMATALALAGDTAALPSLARRIRAMAERSSYGRDRRLPAYVDGLLLEAREDWEGARIAYTAAVWSPTENLVAARLARTSLRTGHPADAVRVLQQYLRGPLDASNQYVDRWEVHRLLGDAFTAMGRRDSASAHYDWVRRALGSAEPPFGGVLDSIPLRRTTIKTSMPATL